MAATDGATRPCKGTSTALHPSSSLSQLGVSLFVLRVSHLNTRRQCTVHAVSNSAVVFVDIVCAAVQTLQLPPQTRATGQERSGVCNLHDAH